MTAKQTSLAELEFPTGGLAEEVSAPEPPRDVRTLIDDIEFLFLTPESPESDEPNSIHTVEEALSTDFLFSFDRNLESQTERTTNIDEAASPEQKEASSSDAVPFLGPQRSPETGFPLTHFQAERQQLEAEIGRLRAELERHRALLTELREGHSLLLPTPVPRQPQDGSRLPAAADVLAGFTSVAEPIDDAVDFRDTEEFRAALPKTRALLGFDEDSDGTLLQRIDGENLSDFRVLAPMERRLPYMEGDSSLLAFRRVIDESSRITDVETPVERTTNEIVVSVRWWNAIPAVFLFLAFAGGVGALAVGSIMQVQARVALQDALRSAPMRTADVEAALAMNDGSFLARFDGRFDYLRARLHDHVNVKNNAQELLSSRRIIDPRVLKLVDRSVGRSPGVGWHRLTRAALATAAKSNDAEQSWKTADAARIDDPLYWEVLGDHYRMIGRHDDALAMFTNVLRRKPTATRDILAMLSEVRIDLKKSVAIVPPDPIAALQATLFIRNEEGRREWREHADALLQRLGAPRPTEDGDDLAARGQLQLLLGKRDDAAASYEAALAREPERNDFRLALAKLRYEQQRFEEAAALAERIVHGEPASGAGEEARVLRIKIDLSTSGRRTGATPAAH